MTRDVSATHCRQSNGPARSDSDIDACHQLIIVWSDEPQVLIERMSLSWESRSGHQAPPVSQPAAA